MASAADRVVEVLEGFFQDLMRAIPLEVTAELVSANPVDTGWSRANWIPSVGAPVTTPAGSRDSVSGVAQQVGMAQVATYTWGQGNVFIANCVPYIVFLNRGHSPQAPAGYVEAAVESGIRKAIVKLGGV